LNAGRLPSFKVALFMDRDSTGTSTSTVPTA
jgi:hypothetical protein